MRPAKYSIQLDLDNLKIVIKRVKAEKDKLLHTKTKETNYSVNIMKEAQNGEF